MSTFAEFLSSGRVADLRLGDPFTQVAATFGSSATPCFGKEKSGLSAADLEFWFRLPKPHGDVVAVTKPVPRLLERILKDLEGLPDVQSSAPELAEDWAGVLGGLGSAHHHILRVRSLATAREPVLWLVKLAMHEHRTTIDLPPGTSWDDCPLRPRMSIQATTAALTSMGISLGAPRQLSPDYTEFPVYRSGGLRLPAKVGAHEGLLHGIYVSLDSGSSAS